MTHYEYNYALQDLLGLNLDLAKDLPPESFSEDGFQNSSEMLQMSSMQFEYYRELGRHALQKATFQGPRPEMVCYGITMDMGAAMAGDSGGGGGRGRGRRGGRGGSRRPTQFKNLTTGAVSSPARYEYQNGKYSFHPSTTLPKVPEEFEYALFVPAGGSYLMDLGDTLPDSGNLRIRILASRVSAEEKSLPAIRFDFGFQPSNNSSSSHQINKPEVVIEALPGKPQFYQWDID